ncbi:MAG TPA: hypothetical protein VM096_08555 [Vicinamibacterales bacterium]|nr:hypothetical protein [Vicinamibacterales bacterium]
MQKVPGISAVRVSLNDGLTILDLKPDNTVTLSRLRDVIRNNGFVTKEATVVAAGSLRANGDQLNFDVGGSKEALRVVGGRAIAEDVGSKAGVGTPTVLTGIVDLTNPKSLTFSVTARQPR